jgi:hypothetical protein
MISVAQAAIRLTLAPSSLLALILHRAKLTDDLVTVDDKAARLDVGHFGEAEPSFLAHEHFRALFGVAGPRTVEIKGIRTAGHYKE